ncbi:hypothetical protein SCE1572_06715 [Sorangium cellulosum So0157-2]|uniref:Uncharacterized protein n=1 Tax=Sorangium cellulosum So0157-2 TaxID=1254432 RepID=S4XQT1_SORCE|nr:hypothetical protein SCE1572_06715 [Sorangium cellulosum So0157-2]
MRHDQEGRRSDARVHALGCKLAGPESRFGVVLQIPFVLYTSQ